MATIKSITAADRKAVDRAYVALVATGAADDRTRFVRAGHLLTLDGFGIKSGAIAAEWNRRAGWDAIAPETVRAILTSAKRVLAADVALDAHTLAASYRARKVPAERLAFLVDQVKANVSPDKRGDALIDAFDQARVAVNAATVAAAKGATVAPEPEPSDAVADGEPTPASVKRAEGAAGDTPTDVTPTGESDAAYVARILGTLTRWADTADRRETLAAGLRDALTTVGAADAADAALV